MEIIKVKVIEMLLNSLQSSKMEMTLAAALGCCLWSLRRDTTDGKYCRIYGTALDNMRSLKENKLPEKAF